MIKCIFVWCWIKIINFLFHWKWTKISPSLCMPWIESFLSALHDTHQASFIGIKSNFVSHYFHENSRSETFTSFFTFVFTWLSHYSEVEHEHVRHGMRVACVSHWRLRIYELLKIITVFMKKSWWWCFFGDIIQKQ